MIEVILAIYWLLVSVLFYTYIGYGIVVLILAGSKKKPLYKDSDDWPELTVVISCYNEVAVIARKIANTKSLDYPGDKLKILIIDDGSTDETATLVNAAGVSLIRHSARRGKAAALNTAMQHVATPLVIFSDANTDLNKGALKLMVRHFSSDKVGGVAGEKKIATTTGLGTAEGWYWQYESFFKKLDAAFYTVIGATGELFALHTALYQPIREDVILDDFFLSVHVCQQGYIISYEPGAYAVEQPSQHLSEEYKRKVRIAAGAFQSFTYISFGKLGSNYRLLFQLASRRWLRWIVCPLAIPILFLLNVIMVANGASIIYTILLYLQVIFYLLALIGGSMIHRFKYSIITLPFYFLFMNYCMLAGLVGFLSGRQTVFWNKAQRSAG